MRLGIYTAYKKNRFLKREFRRFLKEAEDIKEKIGALWRFQAGEYGETAGTMPVEPVTIMLGEPETSGFTALCRDMGIVCIASITKGTAIISLDKNELEKRISGTGLDHLPEFFAFFEEVKSPAGRQKTRDRLFRIKDVDGTIRYYGLKKE
jgi:hypothetical protein